jgi:hypothetical protein
VSLPGLLSFMAKTLIQQSRAISSKQKAEWHELEGAGKSHVKREFFGLNRDDETAIEQRLSDGLDRQLKD